MEKRYYNAASLERILRAYEKGYGLGSEEFYRAHVEDAEAAARIPGWHRQAWAGFYRAWRRLGDSSFADRVERELEIA